MSESTLDLLTRAHKHLTELRDQATKGPWTSARGGDYYTGEDPIEQYSVSGSDGTPITWDDHNGDVFVGPDADLIVALHRTIDAQLEVLDLGLMLAGERHSTHPSRIERIALDLARSILNEGNTDD